MSNARWALLILIEHLSLFMPSCIIFDMNLSVLAFPLLAIGLLCIALLIIAALGGSIGAVSLAFAPVLVWAVVLALRGRNP